MSLSAYLTQLYTADRMPSWAQLDWRQVVVNGEGPNLVLDGLGANDRVMGVLPQQELEVTEVLDAGGPLASSTAYTYGLQRVVQIGGLEIPGQMTLASLTPTGQAKAQFTIEPYEYDPETGALWTVVYRVFRSAAGAPTMLYLVEEVEVTGTYEDTTVDGSLNTALSYNTGLADENGWIPPCRFVRAWRGRFVLAGGLTRLVGAVTIDAGSLDVVEVPEGWTVRPSDVGAQLRIAGLPWVHTIAAVDEAAGTYTLSSEASGAVSGASAWLYRSDGRVYVTNPQPGNIEGYTVGTEVTRNDGAGESICGLAVFGAYLYVLHGRGALLLEVSGESVVVSPFPGGVPGCVSGATVADGKDAPAVFYYAGRAGVVEMQGTDYRNIGLRLERVLRDRVDHGMDSWTHGVYDPERGWYLLWLFEKGGVHDDGLRIPELLLVWDTATEQWYECELAAQSSAVWVSSGGGTVVVVGLPDGLAVLSDESGCDCQFLSGTVAARSVVGSVFTVGAGALPSSGLVGLPLHFRDGAGVTYRYVISSHTTAAVTVAGEILPVPQEGWTWTIGGIRFLARTGYLATDIPENARVERVLVLHEPTAESQPVTVRIRGVREKVGDEVVVNHDFDGVGELKALGAEVGLRGRGFQLELEGDGDQAVTVQQVLVETTEVARHE